jgi:hypothetical protein
MRAGDAGQIVRALCVAAPFKILNRFALTAEIERMILRGETELGRPHLKDSTNPTLAMYV